MILGVFSFPMGRLSVTCHCVIACHGWRVGCPGQRRSGHVDRHARARAAPHGFGAPQLTDTWPASPKTK